MRDVWILLTKYMFKVYRGGSALSSQKEDPPLPLLVSKPVQGKKYGKDLPPRPMRYKIVDQKPDRASTSNIRVLYHSRADGPSFVRLCRRV